MLLILVGMQILGKGPLKGPSDRKLLCHHKGMQCLPNGRIHIVTADMVSQMHPGMGFSHAQQRVQVTDRHRTNETPNGVLNRERDEVFFLVESDAAVHDGMDLDTAVRNVLAQQLLGNQTKIAIAVRNSIGTDNIFSGR